MDVLIRGLPDKAHREVQQFAKKNNLSVNQAIVRMILVALEKMQNDRDEKKEREEIFRRADALRKRLHKKYGKMNDSTKLIREDRDSR